MNGEVSPEIQALHQVYLFHTFSTEELENILEHAEIASYHPGEKIYEVGDPARGFFVLVSGKVRLTRWRGGKQETLQVLDNSGFFGQEILSRGELRHLTAEALSDVRVLKLSLTSLDWLLETHPNLSDDLDLVRSTYQLVLREKMPWRGPKEIVYLMIRRHPVFLLIRLLIPAMLSILTTSLLTAIHVQTQSKTGALLVLAGIFLFIWLAWAVLAWIDWANDYSIVTNRRVAFHEKIILIYDSRREVPLDAVLSDDKETTFLGRLLSFGDVVVRTYTGMLHLPDIPKPEAVRRLLNQVQVVVREASEIKRRATMDDTIRQRFRHEETPAREDEGEVAPVIQPGPLQAWLVNLFQMRIVKGTSIIYRTHWFILLLRLFIPTILNLALFTTLILRLFGVIQFLDLRNFLLLWFLMGLFAIGWWVYQYWDWSNDQYIITDKELIDYFRKPLGREERRSAPLENIQTIDYEQRNLIALIFNYGTVYIRIGDAELTFNNVFNPSDVQRQIFERFLEKKKKKEDDRARAEQERMLEWLESYDRVMRTQPEEAVEGEEEEEEDEDHPEEEEVPPMEW